MPIAPKCHWRGVNNQAQSGGVQRFKTRADQQCGGNCYRCAKACGSFKESAETETDDQHLQTLVRVIERIDERMMSNCPVFTEIL